VTANFKSLKKQCGWSALGLALALLLIGSLVTPAIAQPSLPSHHFWGKAYVGGSLADEGTSIIAKVGDVTYATTAVDSLGRYGWSPTFKVEGAAPGSIVSFLVGGTVAPQTAVWTIGAITKLDLYVASAPGVFAVTTNAATSTTSTTATLNGNLVDLGAESSATVSFEYGPTISYGYNASAGTKTGTGAFTADISSLSAGGTYHYRAKAIGSTTVYGSDVTFTTSAALTPTVATSAATSITSTTARLNGSLDDLGGESSATVSFEYGPTISYGYTASAGTKTGTGAFIADISSLSAGTTYYFRAKAVASGDPVYGAGFIFTTSSVTLAVSTNAATSVTTASATLNGSLTNLGGASTVYVYFQYGPTASYGSTTSLATKTATGTFSAAISSLASGTAYYFRAVAIGSTTEYGSDTTLTTLGGGPTTASHQFYGYVYINGTLASLGTTVAAYVNGVSAASTTTNASGIYGWSPLFYVPGSGGTVTFYVNGVLTPQTATWTSGAITKKNLYATAATLTVSTGSASWASSTSATLGGTLVSFGDDTSATVSIEYGTTTAYGSSTTAESKSSTGSFSGTATGLSAGTTYNYRAKAVGSPSGDIKYGTDATYTHTTGGSLTVTTSAATAGDTIATLNGNLASLGDDTSVAVSFEWGTTVSYGSTVTATQSPLTSTGAFSYPLTGLTNDQEYHYRAKAVGNLSSTTVYGSDVTFTPSATPTPGDKIIGADEGAAINGIYYGDTFQLFKFQAEQDGTINTFKVKAWVKWENGNIKVAIYDDSSGEPGNLRGTGESPVTAGVWNDITITPGVGVVAGHYYWLAFNSSARMVYRTSSCVDGRSKYSPYGDFSFPDDFAGEGFNSSACNCPLIAGY